MNNCSKMANRCRDLLLSNCSRFECDHWNIGRRLLLPAVQRLENRLDKRKVKTTFTKSFGDSQLRIIDSPNTKRLHFRRGRDNSESQYLGRSSRLGLGIVDTSLPGTTDVHDELDFSLPCWHESMTSSVQARIPMFLNPAAINYEGPTWIIDEAIRFLPNLDARITWPMQAGRAMGIPSTVAGLVRIRHRSLLSKFQSSICGYHRWSLDDGFCRRTYFSQRQDLVRSCTGEQIVHPKPSPLSLHVHAIKQRPTFSVIADQRRMNPESFTLLRFPLVMSAKCMPLVWRRWLCPDGEASVRYIATTIQLDTWAAMNTIARGEVIPSDE